MDLIKCPNHSGSLCLLKTGTKPGPSQGVSFYMCTECTFVQQTKQPPSSCTIHHDRTVELQSLVVRKDQKGIRQYFRCSGRDEGKSWCGYKPISEQTKVDSLPLSSQGKNETSDRGDNQVVKEKSGKGCDAVVNKIKVGNADVTERPRNDGETLKGKENVKIDSKQNESVKTTAHLSKASPGNKKNDRPAQPLTFSDLSKGKEVPSSADKGNKTPFQNKSFHRYRDSPDPGIRPGQSARRPLRISDSSDSDSDNEVRDTKDLMQGLTIKDDKDSVKSEAVIGSDRPIKDQDKTSLSLKTEVDTKTLPPCDGAGVKDEPVSQTTKGGGVVSDRVDADVRDRFRNLKEDRKMTVAEMTKLQTSMRGVNVASLPDKGQKLLSRISSYKQHIASLDRQMVELLQRYGNEISKQSDASHAKPNQSQGQQPQVVRVYSQAGNGVKTVIVRPQQPVATESSTTTHANTTTGMSNNADATSEGAQFIQMPLHMSQYFAANPQAMTLYGGRMTAQRLRDVGSITTEAIDKIHKQLESCPGETTEISDPSGLRVPLMSHQRQALAWLDWREQQHPAGGILADDMGLGKTLTMISHMMRKKQEVAEDPSASAKEGWLGKDKQARNYIKKSRGTLIVAPASLIHQWAKEIEKRCSPNCLKFLVYHGPNRETNINRLCDHDVVITTYAIVTKEVGTDESNAEMAVNDDEDEEEGAVDGKEDGQAKKRSLPLLLRIGWERIILDEAHDIKNHKSGRARSVCRLRAAYRWALTGTPIQNDLKDMYSLLRFLRFSPFDELKVWKRHIESAKVSTKRLNTLVKALLLRRTKDQTTLSGKPLVDLPNKTYENIEVELSEEEQKIYDKLFQKTQSTVKAYVHRHQDSDDHPSSQLPRPVDNPSSQRVGDGATHSGAGSSGISGGGGGGGFGAGSDATKPKNTGSQILVFLLRLRQCCSHLSLLKAHLEAESLETEGIEMSLHEQMKGLMLDAGEEEGAPSASDLPKTDVFESSYLSTKLSHVMTKIQTLREEKPTDKSVIVSQWTAMLEIVGKHLKRSKVSYSLIQGNVPSKKRSEIVEDFNRTGAGAKVLLVSLCAGGVGLNLIGGNHLFLLDSHWNPALEAQACDRIYRIGQTKDVKIYRFICKKTIEEKIWMLQQGKLSLAKSVLSGTANKNQKLSLADLRMLFGV